MQRVVVGRSFTLSQTFYVDGVPSDPSPDTATVAITRRSDGTTVATGNVDNSQTGVATVTVPASANTLLDTLDVTWTVTVSGEAQTYTDEVEVGGGYLFTVAQARKLDPFSRTNNDGSFKVATQDIIDTRTLVEQAIEDACRVAFVPRYRLETLDARMGTLVTMPRVRAIRSLTVNGVVYTTDQLAALTFNPDGVVPVWYLPAMTNQWGGYVDGERYGVGSPRAYEATIGYEHGYDTPPARVTRAALLLAKRWLSGSPADDRATSMVTDEQTTTFYVPRSNELFDVPDVNAVVRQYGYAAGVA